MRAMRQDGYTQENLPALLLVKRVTMQSRVDEV